MTSAPARPITTRSPARRTPGRPATSAPAPPPTTASEAVLAAVRGLAPELHDDPSGLHLVADALYELTDALLGMAAAGKLSDETLRALAGLDGVTARLAAALRRERQAASGDGTDPSV